MSGDGQQHEEEVLEVLWFHAGRQTGTRTLLRQSMVRRQSLDDVRQLHLVLQRPTQHTLHTTHSVTLLTSSHGSGKVDTLTTTSMIFLLD